MALTIRHYRDGDRAEMTALYSIAWHATYDPIDGAEAINRVIASLLDGEEPAMFALPVGDVALVAELDDRLVGGIRGHPRAGSVHLSGMYVIPGLARCGIGSALLAELLARFPAGTIVRADVRPTSDGARKFYARYGFFEIGRGRADVGGDHQVDMIELQRGANSAKPE